jgi:exonuclease VII large subunit
MPVSLSPATIEYLERMFPGPSTHVPTMPQLFQQLQELQNLVSQRVQTETHMSEVIDSQASQLQAQHQVIQSQQQMIESQQIQISELQAGLQQALTQLEVQGEKLTSTCKKVEILEKNMMMKMGLKMMRWCCLLSL